MKKHKSKSRRKIRRYHPVDDDATAFEYEIPDWLVGGD